MAPLCGCHMEQRLPATEPLNAYHAKTDGAMAMRRWTPSLAYYASDRIWAGSAYSPLRPDRQLTWPLNAFSETGLFVADTAYIIAGVFIEPPWQLYIYKSITMPPTYTAMPTLPPGAEPTPYYHAD